MKFIALKTKNGQSNGSISFFCEALDVTRQGFYTYLKNRDKPWKYATLAAEMMEIIQEDECNDTYGRVRMHQALCLKNGDSTHIPSERTVYRIMREIGISHMPNRKPNGITKADREAQKSDDLLKRNFKSETPSKKCVTDMTELKARDGKLYVSAIFDCYDASVLGLAMADNMRAELCVETVESAVFSHPSLLGAILHSDRGSQYTSSEYRAAIARAGLVQSMNSAGGRCHDNARCESFWARMKEELFYSRKRKLACYTIDELKTMIWRYFIGYWNNRRICTGNGGLPPMVKRSAYYAAKRSVA